MKNGAMTARTIGAVMALVSLLTSVAFATEDKGLSFSVRGKPVAQLSLADLEKIVPAMQYLGLGAA